MFGIFSRSKAEAKRVPEDDRIRSERIDRALRREAIAAPAAGNEVVMPTDPPVSAPSHPTAAATGNARPEVPEVSVGSDEPDLGRKAEPDLAARTSEDDAPSVGVAPQAVAAAMPELQPASNRTRADATPVTLTGQAEVEVPEVSVGSDEPDLGRKAEPDLAARACEDDAPSVGVAPQADPAAMAELQPASDRTEVDLTPLLKMLHGGFRTTWSTSRAADAAADRPAPVTAAAQPVAAPVDRVLVPRAAFDSFARDAGDYDLVRAVATFVDTMLAEGLYTPGELPGRTLQLYHADQYLSHVNSGGHRRMIHAVGGRVARMLADARTAFIATGATVALDALNSFTDWLAANPDEAARPVAAHDAAAGTPEDLDLVIQTTAMADTVARASAWIAGWDDLVVVDDADYAGSLRSMALANPLRENRLIRRSIRQLHRQLTDPVLAATGMACAGCPDPEIRLAVEGPVTVEVNGHPQSVYVLRTNESTQRLCILDGAGAAIHEQAPTEPTDLDGLSEIEDMEQALATGVLPESQLPRTGRRLAHVGLDRIERAGALAQERHAAAAIDLLLRRAELDPENTAAAPAVIELHPDGETVTFLVATQATPLFVASTPKGAVLVRPHDMQTLVTASAADIAAHAAGTTQATPQPRRAAAGGR